MEEQRRQRELIEKEAYAQNHSVEFEEEASRYYQDDWWKEELVHTKERPRQSPGELFVLSNGVRDFWLLDHASGAESFK